MSITFKFTKAPYDKGDNIYKKATFIFEKGLTVLVGCNGSGKTTLLNNLFNYLKKDQNMIVLKYNNLENSGGRSISASIFNNDIVTAAALMTGSEGENIITNSGRMAFHIGQEVRKNRNNNKPLIILFDAIDSGLSIDNIIDTKEFLFNTIFEDCSKQRDVYIICSANGYELCNEENCFDVQNAKYIKFKNYDEYKHFINKSRKIKDKRFS